MLNGLADKRTYENHSYEQLWPERFAVGVKKCWEMSYTFRKPSCCCYFILGKPRLFLIHSVISVTIGKSCVGKFP